MITARLATSAGPYGPFPSHIKVDSVYFDVEVITLQYRIENMTIQSKRNLIHGISMYGCNYSHTDAVITHYKPQNWNQF